MSNEVSNGNFIRQEKTKDYTILNNQMYKVTNMSLAAKGLLSTMLQLPPDWKFSLNGLTGLCKDSETIVRKALNELMDLGYVTREKKLPSKKNGGRYQMIYTIREKSESDKLVIKNSNESD